MAGNRFHPSRVKDGDQTRANDRLANALNSNLVPGRFKRETNNVVNAAAGDFRRVSPRSGGMTVVVPAASGDNFSKTITLFVEKGQGTLTVRATAGTINGSTSISSAAGTYTVVLTSNGVDGWATASSGGGGGGGSCTDATVTLGYLGKQSDVAAVADASISGSSLVLFGWGTVQESDENQPEMDAVTFSCTPGSGSMDVRITAPNGHTVGGAYRVRYLIG